MRRRRTARRERLLPIELVQVSGHGVERGLVGVGHVATPVAMPGDLTFERIWQVELRHCVPHIPPRRCRIVTAAQDAKLGRGTAPQSNRNVVRQIGCRNGCLVKAWLIVNPVPSNANLSPHGKTVLFRPLVTQVAPQEVSECHIPAALKRMVGRILAGKVERGTLTGKQRGLSEALVKTATHKAAASERVSPKVLKLNPVISDKQIVLRKPNERSPSCSRRLEAPICCQGLIQ